MPLVYCFYFSEASDYSPLPCIGSNSIGQVGIGLPVPSRRTASGNIQPQLLYHWTTFLLVFDEVHHVWPFLASLTSLVVCISWCRRGWKASASLLYQVYSCAVSLNISLSDSIHPIHVFNDRLDMQVIMRDCLW